MRYINHVSRPPLHVFIGGVFCSSGSSDVYFVSSWLYISRQYVDEVSLPNKVTAIGMVYHPDIDVVRVETYLHLGGYFCIIKKKDSKHSEDYIENNLNLSVNWKRVMIDNENDHPCVVLHKNISSFKRGQGVGASITNATTLLIVYRKISASPPTQTSSSPPTQTSFSPPIHSSASPRLASSRFDLPVITLVLSLDRRPDRYTRFLTSALSSSVGFSPSDLQRISAVDGHLLGRKNPSPRLSHLFPTDSFSSPSPISYLFPYGGHKLSPGALGCALSHLQMWTSIASYEEEDAPFLILEDDVQFISSSSSPWMNRLQNLLKSVSSLPSWGLLYLGFTDYHSRGRSQLYNDTYILPNVLHLSGKYPRSFGGGTFAYLIRPWAARILSENALQNGFADPVDFFMISHFKEIQSFACSPPLVESDWVLSKSETDSDIMAPGGNAKEYENNNVNIPLKEWFAKEDLSRLISLRPRLGPTGVALSNAPPPSSAPIHLNVTMPLPHARALTDIPVRATLLLQDSTSLPLNWMENVRVCITIESPYFPDRSRPPFCATLDAPPLRLIQLPYGAAFVRLWVEMTLSDNKKTIISPVSSIPVYVGVLIETKKKQAGIMVDGLRENLRYSREEVGLGAKSAHNDKRKDVEHRKAPLRSINSAPPRLAIGILLNRGRSSFQAALSSWHESGLLQLASQIVLFVQEIIDPEQPLSDPRIASLPHLPSYYNIEIIHAQNANVQMGISGAILEILQSIKKDIDTFLFLEEDWIIQPSEMQYTRERIKKGMDLLYMTPNVDVVRLRSRTHPGDPHCSSIWSGREHELLHVVTASIARHAVIETNFWHSDPSSLFPDHILWKCGGDNEYVCTTSQYAAWTNNPTLTRLEWFRGNIAPVAQADYMLYKDWPTRSSEGRSGDKGRLEPVINLSPWLWDEREYIVAHGNGLFSHNDIDREIEQQSPCHPPLAVTKSRKINV
eukprot:g5821.t1